MGQTFFSLRSLTMLASALVIPAIALAPPEFPKWTHSVDDLVNHFFSRGSASDDSILAINQTEDVSYVHPSMSGPAGRAGLPPPSDRQRPPSLLDDSYTANTSHRPPSLATSYDRPYVAQRQPAPVDATPSPSGENADDEHLLGQLTSRLRDLGACYYRLESWGQSGEMFLFQCRVQVDGDISRHFQVADSGRVQAVRRVVEQVEAWNTSARRTTMFGNTQP